MLGKSLQDHQSNSQLCTRMSNQLFEHDFNWRNSFILLHAKISIFKRSTSEFAHLANLLFEVSEYFNLLLLILMENIFVVSTRTEKSAFLVTFYCSLYPFYPNKKIKHEKLGIIILPKI